MPRRTARIREPISRFHPRPPWKFTGAGFPKSVGLLKRAPSWGSMLSRDKEAVSEYKAIENINIDIAAFVSAFLTMQ